MIAAWAAAATLFQLYTSWIGYLEPRSQRSLFLLFFLPLAFLVFPARIGKSPMTRPSWVDWGLASLALLPNIYSYMEAHRINMRLEGVDPLLTEELVMGSLMSVLAIEAIRRAVSPVLAGLVTLVVTYLFLTEYMPGILNYRSLPFEEIIELMYVRNGMGIFGTITGVATTVVAIFVAFGAFVEGLGLGRLFNNLGTRVAGGQIGGPAKVSIITSAFFGSMSGSSSANVFSTGAFTIPMMKRYGYRPSFAGGVETAASVGGQIMPPIMGAGAFVMAEITRIPFVEIITAAVGGALLYFFMLLVTVHLEARKAGLGRLDKSQLPTWRAILKDLHLLFPIAVLLACLLMRYSPHMSALYSILTTIGVSFLRAHTRPTLRSLSGILVRAGCNITIISMACMGAGMIIAGLTATGLVMSIGQMIATASGGMLLIAGALLMVTTIMLGMGLPTTAAYVITSAIGAPLLTSEFGVPVLAAHMFVFYFAILADATPPVSIAAYAASSIAKAPPLVTGAQAFRLATAGFIVGFSYLYTPALLFKAPLGEIIVQFGVNILALTLVAVSFTGFLYGRIWFVARPLLFVAGVVTALLEAVDPLLRIVSAGGLLALLWWGPLIVERSTASKVGKYSGEQSDR
ncbi:TRAP transporter permease [Fodinicurvata sediminis]|uniref:TRAP transporter permease n=1 Tax=Fodinicurvata sediminis TaxID=1121832 RepID=UPI0003F9BDCA|nr:TRAP transporter fused permease subunit [Fodinicurvata sediminis]